MERWNPCTNAYIKLDHLACITEYNKGIGGEDSLDAMVLIGLMLVEKNGTGLIT